MAKVKCKVCLNEVSGLCTIKKLGVKVNKPRTCEAFVYDETKIKVHVKPPSVKFGYKEQQEAKLRRKEALKQLKDGAEPSNGTAKQLGLLQTANIKHPLTGDLSRFVSSATTEGDN